MSRIGIALGCPRGPIGWRCRRLSPTFWTQNASTLRARYPRRRPSMYRILVAAAVMATFASGSALAQSTPPGSTDPSTPQTQPAPTQPQSQPQPQATPPYRVWSVDFGESLVALVKLGIQNPGAEEIQWARCENITLNPPNKLL